MVQTSSILNELEFNESKASFKVVLNSKETREIRILMRKEQIVKEHSAPFPIVVEVFSGKIDFGVSGTMYPMKSGDLISLPSNIPHDLLAHEDSIIRLSLLKYRNEEKS